MDPIAIAVADFSGNGRQDVAVANGNLDPGQVNVLFGNGAGGFAAPVPTTAGRLLTGIATGDFNADHLADIVVSELAVSTSC